MIDWDHHLEKTSRTFALAIPLLDEPLRREVTLSYLLFRVADTIEDAASWSAAQRSTCLRACADLIQHGAKDDAMRAATRWIELGPTKHAGYLALLAAFPSLLEDVRALDLASVRRIEHHVVRTIDRMDAFVRAADADGNLVLDTKRDLEAYCYAVAGIVGELLTDLFVLHAPRLKGVSDELLKHAPAFGEGLQLVNIARDALDDAREGRAFIPADMRVDDVLSLAHEDLDRAMLYVETLRSRRAPSGIIAFVALPVMLARATLERVRMEGAGAKLSRAEVAELMARVQMLSASSGVVESIQR